jgi:hypothetical protein
MDKITTETKTRKIEIRHEKAEVIIKEHGGDCAAIITVDLCATIGLKKQDGEPGRILCDIDEARSLWACLGEALQEFPEDDD